MSFYTPQEEYHGLTQGQLEHLLYAALRDEQPGLSMGEALSMARSALNAYGARHYAKGFADGLDEQPVTSVDDLLDDDDGVVLSNSHEWSARYEGN